MNINANKSDITHDHETFLHQIRLFSGLTDQELKSIEKGEEVWFEAGEKILAEGAHDNFYVVLDGKVEVILRDESKEAVLSSYDSGDHFGELPIILGWSNHKCARLCYEEKPSIKMGRRGILANDIQFPFFDQTDSTFNGKAS